MAGLHLFNHKINHQKPIIMKKIAVLIAAFLFVASGLHAQEQMFNKGDKVVNVGIGLLSALYTGSYYTSKLPPLSVSYEQGVVDNVLDVGTIGVGGYLGFASAKWEMAYIGGTYGWKYTNIILGARGAFHYPLVDKLDTYAGLLLGYNIVSAKEIGTIPGNVSASSSGVIFSGYVGGRYYFNDKFGAMAELGTGIAYLNIGLAVKLK